MASFAHLSREERLGLGVAAVAHVALVAALVWQVRDEPTPLPIPERMTVSLADEVSLQSTSPKPAEASAAVAPELAPVPAPPPEPVPTVAAREQVRPVARPTRAPVARPTTRPTPPPTQPRTAGGSRLGADFLEGAGSGERTESRGNPGTFGAAEQASLRSAISRQLRPHWSSPQGVDVEKLVTMLDWDLNPDGSLAGRPRLRAQTGLTDSNRPQAARHVELAIRAVQLAAPFDLPEEYYDHWKRIRNWRFDRNTAQ
jgi:hypothetical protein